MQFRKTPEEKEQKQVDMVKLDVSYEKFLASKISEKRNLLVEKYPEIKTIFQGWLYGVYVALLDYQQSDEQKGKIYYLFENISESNNKYSLSYTIDDEKNCIFNVIDLKKLPKSYLSILKRHRLNLAQEKSDVASLVAAHSYKLDETSCVTHSDGNSLNNNIKNIVPLEKVEFKQKTKEAIKLEYRTCDLYYNHKIPVEKIAHTLRLKKEAVQRTVKLYSAFKNL